MSDFYFTYRSLFEQVAIGAIYAYALFIVLRAGQLSVGHVAFGAAGAYTAAILTTEVGVPLPVALAAGVLVAIAMAILLGVVVMRLQAVFLAIATLAFGEVVRIALNNWRSVTGGALGYPVLGTKVSMPYVLAALVLVCWSMYIVFFTRFGRSIDIVGSDDVAASTQGLDVSRIRLVSFGISGMVAGLAGGIDVHFNGFVQPNSFDLFFGLEVLLYVVVGGSQRWFGPLVGALVMVPLPTIIRELGFQAGWVGQLFQGVVLLAVILLRPGGISSLIPRKGGGVEIEPSEARLGSPLSLDVRSVSVHFGGIRALDEVSLSVKPGTTVGLIGPNGAGKTTLVNAITGLQSIDSGAIRVGGRPTDDLKPHEIAGLGVRRSFQNIRLFDELSVIDNVMAGTVSEAPETLWGRLIGSAVARHQDRQEQRAAQRTLVDAGIAHLAGEQAGSLPYGARRKVEIARAVAANPGLLVLDEPAAGMNQSEEAELAEYIRTLNNSGRTILLVEHNMNLVRSICDQVVVLLTGSVLTAGPTAAVFRDDRVVEAYLGT